MRPSCAGRVLIRPQGPDRNGAIQQAERQGLLLNGDREVPIFGEPMQLRAEVVSLDALSGHADQGELIDWMRPMAPHLKKVFLVHGDLAPGAALADVIRKEFHIDVQQPSRGHSFLLT